MITQSDLQLQPPPRRISASLVLAYLLDDLAVIGWGFLLIGLLLSWMLAAQADLSFINFRGPFALTTGEVTRVVSTRGAQHRRQIYAVHYQYSAAARRWEGVSYAAWAERLTSGQQVSLEYDPKDPGRSRIRGMRRGLFRPEALWALLFPVLGCGILVVTLRTALERLHLLRCGVLAPATLKQTRATRVELHGQPMFQLVLEFRDGLGRQHEAVVRTLRPLGFQNLGHDPVLYDPQQPTKVFALSDAPVTHHLGPDGVLLGPPLRPRRFVLPLIVLSGLGLAVFLAER